MHAIKSEAGKELVSWCIGYTAHIGTLLPDSLKISLIDEIEPSETSLQYSLASMMIEASSIALEMGKFDSVVQHSYRMAKLLGAYNYGLRKALDHCTEHHFKSSASYGLEELDKLCMKYFKLTRGELPGPKWEKEGLPPLSEVKLFPKG